MRLQDTKVGMNVFVTRGYSRRPAVVRVILPDGRVEVQYTDMTTAASVPYHQRGALFGAVVRPNQIEPR